MIRNNILKQRVKVVYRLLILHVILPSRLFRGEFHIKPFVFRDRGTKIRQMASARRHGTCVTTQQQLHAFRRLSYLLLRKVD